MADESLLCVNCGSAPPEGREKWSRCVRCAELNLPATYYCGEECMKAHWPVHRQYHKEQKQQHEQRLEGTLREQERSAAESQVRIAEATGDEYCKRFADALALHTQGNLNAAAKALRKIIKRWPERPETYHNLAVVMERAERETEAGKLHLVALELSEEGTEQWAFYVAAAFDSLKTDACRDVPKPEWWNDEVLKALSARVVAFLPNDSGACAMRAYVLTGGAQYVHGRDHAYPWEAGSRSASDVKEAATWFRRAAKAHPTPAIKLIYEKNARRCDESADPQLAKEQAKAAEARDAAKIEVEKAHAAAEAKATAAADELLAEEEKEKTQAASTKAGKAKQSKGKKGKGKGKR